MCYQEILKWKGPVIIIYVGGGGESWGGSGLFLFREKGWAKREFHDD